MKCSRLKRQAIMLSMAVTMAWLFGMGGTAYAASDSVNEYECTYRTYPIRSVNYSCDYGIQHVLITFTQIRYGQIVDPNDDFGYGKGVSYVPLLSGEAMGISQFWTRVFYA